MKLVIDRDLFTRGLARVQGVVNRKATMPMLANVLLEARPGGTLRLAATDLDVTLDSTLPAEVEVAGRVTVDGKRLYEIARSLPDTKAEVSVDEDHRMTVCSRNAEFVVNGLSADGYPELPSASDVEIHAVDGEVLHELIERTVISVSNDESRPNLNGVYFHCTGDGRIRMVSTDGHRLSRGERDARRDGDIPERDGVVIPRKGVNELKRLLEELGREVRFGFLENNLVVEGEDVRLFVRLIDAAFPDYTQVIPKSSERRVVLDRLAFLASLRRIDILASERTHGVRIALSESTMTLTSDNPDLGKAREEIPLESYDGGDMSIAFNSRYVVDILGVLGEPKVAMLLNESLSPGLFQEAESKDYLFVVMPMRL